ncbi:hypothetical protein ACFFX0_17430 [Citricoccus parietis]|uniref:Uncharacterized protein n=1 Tax=Citricoccus parietis TaxID=592307 RepID=A0ABV5G1S3_9MICC
MVIPGRAGAAALRRADEVLHELGVHGLQPGQAHPPPGMAVRCLRGLIAAFQGQHHHVLAAEHAGHRGGQDHVARARGHDLHGHPLACTRDLRGVQRVDRRLGREPRRVHPLGRIQLGTRDGAVGCGIPRCQQVILANAHHRVLLVEPDHVHVGGIHAAGGEECLWGGVEPPAQVAQLRKPARGQAVRAGCQERDLRTDVVVHQLDPALTGGEAVHPLGGRGAGDGGEEQRLRDGLVC